MKKIPLGHNKFAIVDNVDFEKLNVYKWHLSKGYAARSQYSPQRIFLMHREILQTPIGFETDHINQNRLDNRRNNLRIASSQQNNYNRTKGKNTSSKYKGVVWNNRCKKWQVYVKETYIGLFKTEHQAALAYDLWAKDIFGDYAKLNFPGGLHG